MAEIIDIDIPKKGRQQQRSEATQLKLMKATVECLAEQGYTGISMEKVVALAGVSRGAQVHHFPAKTLLLQASFRWMLDQLIDDLRARTASIAERRGDAQEVFRYLWRDYFAGRLFAVTMELITASRTDPELRAALVPVTERFHAQVDECFSHLSSDTISDARLLMAVNLTMALLRGMGVQTVLYDRPAYYRAMLDQWLTIVDGLLAPDNPD